ncbi:MAG TPA: FMN-binding negative transcriptional regulator [Bryobacteraceae bacterium]|nr:FMN-binding negative transcriptional regulator [Bryobacteraceae bacterium]
MYVPKVFAVEELPRLHAFMDEFSFAAMVTQHDGQMIASHIPFILDRSVAPYGVLRAHIAIRNPQLKDIQAGSQALVIFQGPHTYVSPSWYVKPENVPTWNYTVVHATGVPQILDRDAMAALLKDLTGKHEQAFEKPWDFDPGSAWIEKLLPEIAGFEIKIEKLEGKFKLNQNRTPADRAGVIEALSASEDPGQRAVAGIMTQQRRGDLS